ncbi:MAG: 5-formyltetrahydrofolate cyclo-ligase [Ekhidna sp.]
MESHITKSTLRKTILQYRRLLAHDEFIKRNENIISRLQLLVDEEDSKVIHTFLPIKRNKEVDVTPLFEKWWEQGKRIVVSQTDFKTRKMNHYFLKKETVLKNNSLGIPEPINADPAKLSDSDLILVPLLASDKNQDRIGYGGGFYDQLLNETKALKVGLSLSSPMDEISQKDEWDIPLDYIISYK